MAQRAIREVDARKLLAANLGGGFPFPEKAVQVTADTDWNKLTQDNPWLLQDKLVCKPDQLFGKRGKHDLILLNASLDELKAWVGERLGKEVTIGKAIGTLTHFLIVPFTPHDEEMEYYVAIKSERDGDAILVSPKGGIFVEEHWDQVKQTQVSINVDIDTMDIGMPDGIPAEHHAQVTGFIKALYRFYSDLQLAFLELNPYTIVDGTPIALDMRVKLDDTAAFEAGRKWGDIEFPVPFGRTTSPEEEYIKEMDEKSGASLKLTILNPKGRVWTMVAGGGASVIYADTISDLGFGKEMANYGEYSGNPKTDETYEYAKTMLDLMTREKDPQGRDKVLLIGGGIANFTDVAKTFTGIIKALKEYAPKMKETGVRIYVRRGGPNYRYGLKLMRELGDDIGMPIEVYGPETHMTRIVSLALGGDQ
ncbi:MAG: ATP citrate lyase citrate-binding domain-containing protein [Candidatus Undinarchaeales archaeon]|jgi:ATP-citrate lyase beta-subunit|nr:ATP citrate lyase citrate-binding domain-containing protein [Candidatus Undinarchaeales archaeon]